MEQLETLLEKLEPRHRKALMWFAENAGTTKPWPGRLPDGTLLVNKAKAIYKPEWSNYALSVRQNPTGPYHDQPVSQRPDGTWSFLYFQEGVDPRRRDLAFTNLALLNCIKDKVPIGVLVQSKSKPSPRYRVLGLALVVSWNDGFFGLEGFSKTGVSVGSRPRAGLEILAELEREAAESSGEFNPDNIIDARKRILRQIAVRGGQKAFRENVARIYDGKCAVTGYSAISALEAAHIVPYMGPETDDLTNGLLLRADIHTLFDLGLIAIDSSTMKVLLSPELLDTEYVELAGKTLRLPSDNRFRPSESCLDRHRALTDL